MIKNNKGFTLIELLAVIVILALILLIAVPQISNQINKAKRDSFLATAKMIMKTIDYDLLSDTGAVEDCTTTSGTDGAKAACRTHYDLSSDYEITVVETTPNELVTITLAATPSGKFANAIVAAGTPNLPLEGATITVQANNSITYEYDID